MRQLLELLENLCYSESPDYREASICKFFEDRSVGEFEKNFGLQMLLGHYPKKTISSKSLFTKLPALTGFSDWMIQRCQQETGNMLQTIILLLKSENPTTTEIEEWTVKIQASHLSFDQIIKLISEEAQYISDTQRLILLKILTGIFKTPVSKKILYRSLSHSLNLAPEFIAIRIFLLNNGNKISLSSLKVPTDLESRLKPVAFPLSQKSEHLPTNPGLYMIFGLEDGIDFQLIQHDGVAVLWTNHYEIINDKFTDIIDRIPFEFDFSFTGKIVPYSQISSAEQLRSRLTKKSISAKDIEACRPKLKIWKLKQSQIGKKAFAEMLDSIDYMEMAVKLDVETTEELEKMHDNCRAIGFVGVCWHNTDSNTFNYMAAKSYAINATLMYAEFGSMTNSGIKSLTFGVFHLSNLVPIAKIDQLENVDINLILDFVKNNTTEKFGPVRTVKSELAFEIHFDSATRSARKKSGLTLGNPKIHQFIGHFPSKTSTLDELTKMVNF